ncbi:hypothetical protein D3C75_708130 [compost metagenome]
MKTCSNQTGNVSHIHHEERADIIGNGTKRFKVNSARVCTCTGNNQFRTVFEGGFAHFIIINQECIFLHAISYEVIQQSGGIYRTSVRQMTAVSEIHAEHSVTGIQCGQINCHIGLSTGMRLDIGMISAEQLLGTVTGKVLYDIDIFTAAIVAFARITFSIFIRKNRTHRFHYSFTDDILRSNKLNVGTLTVQLQSHRFQYCRVTLAQLFHDFLFPP